MKTPDNKPNRSSRLLPNLWSWLAVGVLALTPGCALDKDGDGSDLQWRTIAGLYNDVVNNPPAGLQAIEEHGDAPIAFSNLILFFEQPQVVLNGQMLEPNVSETGALEECPTDGKIIERDRSGHIGIILDNPEDGQVGVFDDTDFSATAICISNQ